VTRWLTCVLCLHLADDRRQRKAQLPCKAAHRDGLKLLAQQARLLALPLLGCLLRRLEAWRHGAATALKNKA